MSPNKPSPYLTAAPDAIVIVNNAGVIEFANTEAERLFGRSVADLEGRPIEDLLPEDGPRSHVDLRDRYFADPSLRPMASPASAVRARRADGTTIAVDVALSPIETNGQTTVMAVVRDITERAEIEADLRQAIRERDRSEALLGVLAELRMAMLEGRPRNQLFDLVTQSLVALHDGTFATVVLAGEDSLRMSSYATAAGVVDPPAPQVPLNSALEAIFAGGVAQVFPGPGPGTPQRVRDWLTGTSEVLLAPVTMSDDVDGLLVVGRPEGAPAFDAADREGLTTMARDIALALSLREAERHHTRMLVVEDRERIARDLHDVVLQRLFSIGMRLQSSLADPERIADRVISAVEELDETVRVVRDSIFDVAGDDPFSRLSASIEAHEVASKVDVEVETSGDFSSLPAELVDSLVAVVDEALTNVLRHASASEAEVRVVIDDAVVRVVVQDNGIGLGVPSPGGRGIERLRAEAEALGGAVSVGAAQLGGVEIRWEVPYPAPS